MPFSLAGCVDIHQRLPVQHGRGLKSVVAAIRYNQSLLGSISYELVYVYDAGLIIERILPTIYGKIMQ